MNADRYLPISIYTRYYSTKQITIVRNIPQINGHNCLIARIDCRLEIAALIN
jgi:hypothetical protein